MVWTHLYKLLKDFQGALWNHTDENGSLMIKYNCLLNN